MSAERRAPSPSPIRLLLVSPDQSDHQLVCDLLDDNTGVRFTIDWARDLSAGRDRLTAGHVDICLIDPELPDGDGMALIETAAAPGIETPIIVISHHGSTEMDRHAMALGAAGFLDKERLDPVLLERTIRYAMRHQDIVSGLGEAALRDGPTGLVTPILFRDRLTRALAVARRHQTAVALVLIDLGQDPAISDSRERHLPSQAKRLARGLRETDTVAMLTKQQLGLIIEGLRRADDAALVTRKALERLAQTDDPTNPKTDSACSAGIALYPRDCGDSDAMLRQAETALRRAKEEKNGGYRFGCEQTDQEAQRPYLLSNELKQALGQGALALRFRPMVHVADNAISLSAEIYANGAGPRPLSRDRFLPIADDRPLISALTDWMMKEASTQLLAWKREGLNRIDLSLPFISARPVDLPILERSIRQYLSHERIAPDQLEIDLDQDLIQTDLTNGGHGLAALKATGVRIALDEFGRDQTSLHELAHDRLDSLKLSSRLYHQLPGDGANDTLFKAIVNLGHDLDLRVVANGARNERQFVFLKNVGCDAIKLSAADSLLSAEMLTVWLQKFGAPAFTDHARVTCKSGPLVVSRQRGSASVTGQANGSLSPLSTP